MKQKIQNAIQETIESIQNFNLTFQLRDQVSDLRYSSEKQEDELRKLKREYKHLKTRLEGIKKIEKQFFNGESKLPKDAATQALKEEVKRLMKIIDKQAEVIRKTPFISNEITSVKKPRRVESSNYIRFARNLFQYKKESDDYREKVLNNNRARFHFNVEKDGNGITVDSTNSSFYKSEYIKEHGSHIEVGEKLRRYYYLADIPAYLSPYIFFRLLTSPLPFTLSVFIEPASSAELLKKARQRLSVLEMQQNERVKGGKVRDQQLDKNISEVMSFIDELVHEEEKGVVYALYLQLEAEDENELKAYHKELQTIAGSMDLTFNQYTFGHKQAFKNFLPFTQDHLQENRILQSTAVSYLMPFVSKQLNDPDGIFMGVNAYNESLVFIDPFTSRNNNVNIFGVSGSGKSVTSKVLMNRLYMRGVQILAIDPEGEYVGLAKKLGGEVIQFSRDNGINPFYINSSRENDILDHISTLKTFFRFFIPADHYDGALLDETLIKLYDSGTPNFENMLELLGDHPMKKDLSVLSTGSLRGIFNSDRKLELDNDIIVLDLHNLRKDEKREPAMYLLTSLIWNLLNKNNDKKRMLFIDEAHKLLVDPEVAVFYRELVKQARKRNVGVVSITQDVEDFLHNDYGKAIITNSETKILLKQSYAALSEIGTIYPMTDEEKKQMGHLSIGEVILFREGEHVRLNITVLPFEKPLVFTD
ncbi:ATP-binding protein [Candidatus Roizmanbacteria bacterium]|nr:MAG: ATP-binding protein [Candidatus Roizmanbacteria bacterium]